MAEKLVSVPGVEIDLANVDQAIREMLADIRSKWVQLAALLYVFHRGKGWFIAGYDTLEEWLASPDVDISRRMFFLLTECYRELVVERNIPAERLAGVDMTKAQAILPALRRGLVEWPEALADARVLPRDALREKYRTIPTITGEIDRSIKPDEFIIRKCPTCGQNMRIPVQ